MIRPELAAVLTRWREVLAALALVALALWWALGSYGVIRWLGWGGVALGAALAFGALQRMRFAPQGEAPGLVEIDEAEIRYFGPRGGGIVALDQIAALSLSADAGFWLIEVESGHVLAIPRAAQGSEALFDAFSSLPGLEIAHLLRTLAQGQAARVRPVWRRPVHALLT